MEAEFYNQLASLMNQVFCNEDILEVILSSIPSTSLKDILSLRLVSKLWRKVTFKVFHKFAKSPLQVAIIPGGKFCGTELTKFVGKMSPQCNLPIEAIIRLKSISTNHLNIMTRDQLNFFQEYSKYIVNVDITITREHDDNGIEPFPTELYTLHLPRLEEVTVYQLPNTNIGVARTSTAFKLIDGFVHSSKRIKTFQFEVIQDHLGDVITGNANYEIHPAVTSLRFQFLYWNDTFRDYLLNANLANLRQLQIISSSVAEGFQGDEVQIFDEVINKLGPNLEELILIGYIRQQAIQLTIDTKMAHLKTLYLAGVSIQSGVKSTPLSELLPELETLRLHCGGPYSCSFESVKALHINGSPEFSNLKSLRIHGSPRSRLKNKFSVQLLQPFRTVKHLDLLVVHPPTIFKMLPSVFTNLIMLEELEMAVLPKRSTTLKVEELLTGVKEEDIPADERLWNDILTGNPHSITNLKCLRRFSIQFNRCCPCNISTFVFAALFMLPQLTSIELKGNEILVDEELRQKWINSNRSITIITE